MEKPVSLPPSGSDADNAFDEALGSSPAAQEANPAKTDEEEEVTSETEADDKKTEETAKGEEEGKEDAPESDDELDKDKSKKPDDAPKPFKIGSKEFAKAEDAIAEANRIHGRNAKLAGDAKDLQKKLDDAKTEGEKRDTRLKELEKANQAWSKWAEDQTGERPESTKKDADPDEIADRVISKLKKSDEDKATQTALEKELSDVEALANYDDVADLVEKLSDKINPLTDKNFTPKEAYRYAAKELGLDNLLEKKPDETKTKEVPKPKENPAKAAAARPAGGAAPQKTKKAERDFGDDMLEGI